MRKPRRRTVPEKTVLGIRIDKKLWNQFKELSAKHNLKKPMTQARFILDSEIRRLIKEYE